MDVIVQNLCLIPALPIRTAGLTALARWSGAERRQMVAHGVSRGYLCDNESSLGEAAE